MDESKHPLYENFKSERSRKLLPAWMMAQNKKELRQWLFESFESLTKEFSESRLLRLAKTRPEKIGSAAELDRVLNDIKKIRFYMRDSSRDQRKDLYTWGNGWGRIGPFSYYIATTSRIAKYDLLIEDLEERLGQLEAEEKQAAESLKRIKEAGSQFTQVDQDVELASALWHALDTTPPTVGFVYFKRWTMPDGSSWFKVGVSNNPNRREIEQNVLPVAAETITCIEVGSMDRARAIESAIHKVLDEQRITVANNRELFYLSNQQASAVKAVLEKLE